MNAYRVNYEKDGILRDLDKWCVVEWPKNFQHGYDADISDTKVCEQAHVSINAYYIYAVRVMNEIAKELNMQRYRDVVPLVTAFNDTFYDKETGLFVDSENSKHKSLVGNAFAYGFNLAPSDFSKKRILELIDANGISALSLFCTFPILMRFAKDGDTERLRKALLDDGAWLRMLKEGATTTFEGWGKETKWNTSLFHLTMSYAVVFMADIDLKNIFI